MEQNSWKSIPLCTSTKTQCHDFTFAYRIPYEKKPLPGCLSLYSVSQRRSFNDMSLFIRLKKQHDTSLLVGKCWSTHQNLQSCNFDYFGMDTSFTTCSSWRLKRFTDSSYYQIYNDLLVILQISPSEIIKQGHFVMISKVFRAGRMDQSPDSAMHVSRFTS